MTSQKNVCSELYCASLTRPVFASLATFRLQCEDDYEYEFSLLNTRFRFGGRKFSKCASSELKTRTRSRPRSPIWRSLLTRARAQIGFPRSHIHTLDRGLRNSRNIRICMRKTVIFPSLKYTKKQIWIKTNLICYRCMFPYFVWRFLGPFMVIWGLQNSFIRNKGTHNWS